mgnify:CR=1 FL=1
MKNILCTICMRSGSVGLKNKHLVNLKGKPLMYHTIDFINFSNYDCIVDGILGAGLRGSCKENILDVIQLINQSRKNVISLDIPTGLGTQTCVHPTQTITYGFPKKIFKTHYQFCGDIYCIDIEIPRLACLNLLKCSCNFFDESSIIKIRYIHE